ncbi:hypothetical protein OPT61_g5760 [Boeremia exigua]|uniref:Uncharacterized protein n=1 Tax=Boeremia exigua TaxID=749465 RepID=A0ACC2I963_9PLEO|nr:hypothetical protein OPT61_g5760 [Boeremia exigua]
MRMFPGRYLPKQHNKQFQRETERQCTRNKVADESARSFDTKQKLEREVPEHKAGLDLEVSQFSLEDHAVDKDLAWFDKALPKASSQEDPSSEGSYTPAAVSYTYYEVQAQPTFNASSTSYDGDAGDAFMQELQEIVDQNDGSDIDMGHDVEEAARTDAEGLQRTASDSPPLARPHLERKAKETPTAQLESEDEAVEVANTQPRRPPIRQLIGIDLHAGKTYESSTASSAN